MHKPYVDLADYQQNNIIDGDEGWLWVSEADLEARLVLSLPGGGEARVPEDVRRLGLEVIAVTRALEVGAA